jgi:hypothetical protein
MHEGVDAGVEIRQIVSVGEGEKMPALESQNHHIGFAGIETTRRIEQLLSELSEAGLVDVDI